MDVFDNILVKGFTMWVLDDEFSSAATMESCIDHGIWMVKGAHISEKCPSSRYFDMECILSFSDKVKIGDRRNVWEALLLSLCHPIEFVHLPKIEFALSDKK